jgi:uridine phosphorylase
MRPRKYPILDFDASRKAIIEPGEIIQPRDYARRVVFCFFYDVIADLVKSGKAVQVDRLISEIGENPIYQMEFEGKPFMLVHPGVGAPLAAAFLEEMIARGCDKFVACGGAGVLDPNFKVGHVLIPTEAVRDEGTSYAYLPAGQAALPSAHAVEVLQAVLEKHQVPHDRVKAWTTDAIYRETPARVRLRRRQGCSVVEMEAAAFFAVAQFRGVEFGQYLYGGDSVQESGWDDRQWDKRVTIRERLLWLAAEAVVNL